MLERPSRLSLVFSLLIAVLTVFTARPIIVLIPPESCVQANCCCAAPEADSDSCCRCDPDRPSIQNVCGCDHRRSFTLDLGHIEPRLPVLVTSMSTLEVAPRTWPIVLLSAGASRTIAPDPPPPRLSV